MLLKGVGGGNMPRRWWARAGERASPEGSQLCLPSGSKFVTTGLCSTWCSNRVVQLLFRLVFMRKTHRG